MSRKYVGEGLSRFDGPNKIAGRAKYTADIPLDRIAHGVLARGPIGAGRIRRIDIGAARSTPGVVAVFTHENSPRFAPAGVALGEGPGPQAFAGQGFMPMQDDRVLYWGQPIAMIVADTLEAAQLAASRIDGEYEPAPVDVDMDARLDTAYTPINKWGEPIDVDRGVIPPLPPGSSSPPPSQERGSLGEEPGARDGQYQAVVNAVYHSAHQHHAAMEMHATTAHWDGDRLTVYEPTTWVFGARKTLAAWFSMPEDKIRVVNYFVGGSFGCKGPSWPHVALTAMAARETGRPVRTVLSRPQTFTSNGWRPRIRHHIGLRATHDGALTALRHDVIAENSMFDNRIVAHATKSSRKIYACPNMSTRYKMVNLNFCGPFTMRGPGEAPGIYALECAMDELAYELDMDPMELRLRNHAEVDPENGKPWSSKSLRECYRQGAERFGWDKRNPTPRSMRTADGRLLGMGMSTMVYDARTSPTKATSRMSADGSVVVRSGTCEQGTGSYTIFPQIAADELGVDIDRIRFELGDTDMPFAPISAGSRTAASVGSAVQSASIALRRKLLELACETASSPLYGKSPADLDVDRGRIFVKSDPNIGETYADIAARQPGTVDASGALTASDEEKKYTMYVFGAHFAEVAVDPDLGEVRVTRYTAAFGAGRILNAKTARSQLIGGIVWGIGQALTEETHVDIRNGKIVNDDLAEYHVPVNADVPAIDAFFVEEEDPRVNPLGVKGIGEIGTIGAAAAIANAVFHATGKRIRDVPITPDKLLA